MARVRIIGRPGIAPGRVKHPDIPQPVGARPTRGRPWGVVRRNARGVVRCRRGAYAVEFAMLVPIFVPILMGAVEVAWQFGAAVALDHASLEASRFGSMGRDSAGGPACVEAIKQKAIAAAGGFLRSNRLQVLPTQWGNATGMRNKTGGTTGTGSGGSFVEYRLQYDQTFLVAAKLFGRPGLTHVATTTVRNEPYPNATNTLPC